jgi:hypothetical protein
MQAAKSAAGAVLLPGQNIMRQRAFTVNAQAALLCF